VKRTRISFFSGILLLTLGSCALIPSSRSKIQSKRTYAKFNTLYNGEQAFRKFLDQRNSNKINLLEPLSPLPKWYIPLPSDTASSPTLELVEEKAAKAIQKYSIEVNQKEENDQLDRAYELLGFSRYFNARPFPALEAFRKLSSYSNRNQAIASGHLGEAFVFFAIENYLAAEEALDKIETLAPKKWKQQYLAALLRSQIKLETKDTSATIQNLQQALRHKVPDTLKRRTQWILAQLFQEARAQDSANELFDKLAKDNSYDYAPYRILAKIALIDQEKLDLEAYHKTLDQMLKRWNNYEEQGLIYRAKGLKDLSLFKKDTTENQLLQSAISHFNSSNELGAPELQVANFDTLVNFELQRRNYLKAQSYLDSLLLRQQAINPSKLEARQKSHEQISELFKLLERSSAIDTLLAYAELSDEERINRITAKVRSEVETKQKRERAEQMLSEMEQKENVQPSNEKRATSFYFNNEQSIKSGKQAFETEWGSRSNVDYWILRSISPERIIADAEIKKGKEIADRSPAPSSALNSEIESIVRQRLGEVPNNFDAVNDLIKEKIEALFRSASIYYYAFKDYTSAVGLLEPLLKDSSELIRANTLYTLYLISVDTDVVAADSYKEELLLEHPNSLFARHLNSKGIETARLEKKLAKRYLDQEHQELRSLFDSINKAQLRISPSAALLFAKNEFKVAGLQAFEVALEQLRLLYPNSYLSREAIRTLGVMKLQSEKAANSEYAKNRISLAVDVSKTSHEQQKQFRASLAKALNKQNYLAKAYIEQFDAKRTLVVVHRFFDVSYAQEFIDNNPELLSKTDSYILTESDYIKAYQSKDWSLFSDKQVLK